MAYTTLQEDILNMNGFIYKRIYIVDMSGEGFCNWYNHACVDVCWRAWIKKCVIAFNSQFNVGSSNIFFYIFFENSSYLLQSCSFWHVFERNNWYELLSYLWSYTRNIFVIVNNVLFKLCAFDGKYRLHI